jgi:tetratricopeptide (TPR) repeat protein
MKSNPKTNTPVRIALAMIVKDDSEAQSFELCLDSIMGSVDGLYVAVTGVSGEHKKIHEIVKKYGGTSISTSPETHPDIYAKIDDKWIFANFSAARNVSFDMVPEGYDYITWADSDDIVVSSEELRKVAQRSKELKLDQVYFVYWYAVRTNDEGQVTDVIVDQIRERLLKPKVFKWVSRLHEVCVPIESGFKPKNSLYEFDEKKQQLLVWVHTADYAEGSASHQKITGRNKQILDIQVEEENYKDPRTLFYLGKTCYDIGTPEMLQRAKNLLTRYREMSGWDAERANSLEYLGLIAAREENYRECVHIYHMAIQEYPHNHLAYLRLSEAYLNLGSLSFAKHWMDVAMSMSPPKAGETVGQPFEIKLVSAALQYRIALAENDMVKMEEWARIRKGLMGGKDDGLLEEVLKAKALNTAATGTFNLSKWLKDNNHAEIVPQIIDMLPKELVDQPYLALIYKNIIPPRDWGDKEIAYFASFGGPHFEQWGPKSLEKGIGGSETAVLELSKEWAKSGYKVTVFCDCGDEEGEHDGVTFKPYYKMNWNDNFNILILWRNSGLLDTEIKAKKLYFDAHDVMNQTDWTQERMDKVDKVFMKSNFHRRNIPDLPDSKAVVISNGLRI